jgi:hypothetical protein
LLIIISRQGLSRLGKKPSMALIEPVQFCRATSLFQKTSCRTSGLRNMEFLDQSIDERNNVRHFSNLRDFYQRHHKKTAIIFGGGPSLNDLPDSFFYSKLFCESVVFASNIASLRVPRIDYFLFTDGAVPKATYFHEAFSKARNVIYANSLALSDADNEFILSSLKSNIRYLERRFDHFYKLDPATDTLLINGIDYLHPCAHLAHIMGCDKIVLIGVDLCCLVDGFTHFIDDYGVYPDFIKRADPESPYMSREEYRSLRSKDSVYNFSNNGLNYRVPLSYYLSYLVWKKFKEENPLIRFSYLGSTSLLSTLFPREIPV